jgi:hypothetical protein
MRIRWGLTGKEEARIWNYEENRKGSGCFFETPVGVIHERLKRMAGETRPYLFRAIGVILLCFVYGNNKSNRENPNNV